MTSKEKFPILAPALSANDDQFKITHWFKKNNERVKEGDVLASGESSKAAFEIIITESGYLEIIKKKENIYYFAEPIAFVIKKVETSKQNKKSNSKPIESNSKFTAKAAKLISRHGISINEFKNSNIITESMVLDYLKNGNIKNSVDIKPLSLNQLSMNQSLVGGDTRPIGYVAIQCSSAEINKATKKVPFEISFSEAIVFATVKALMQHKELNSIVDGKNIKIFADINIGYAINIDFQGLKLPVIRKAQDLTLEHTKNCLMQLKMNYIRNEFSLSNFSGLTFAITDLTSAGTHLFIPNLPVSITAILGVCAPIEGNNQFNLCMSFDHRVYDGARATRFLKDIESILMEIGNAI